MNDNPPNNAADIAAQVNNDGGQPVQPGGPQQGAAPLPQVAMNQDQLNQLLAGVANMVIGQQQQAFANIQAQVQAQQQAAALPVGGMAAGQVPGGRARLRPLEEASGSAWLVFKTQFQAVREINGWNDLRQRQELKAAMAGEAARATQDITATNMVQDPNGADGALVDNRNIEIMMTLFEERFLPAAASHTAKIEFRNLKQKPGETIALYQSRARDIFMRAFPGTPANTSDHMVHAFLEGLIDAQAIRYSLEREPTTLQEAVDLVQRKLAIEYGMAKRTDPTSTARGVFSMDPSSSETRISSSSMPTASSSMKSNLTCWTCGKRGHVQRDCFANATNAPLRRANKVPPNNNTFRKRPNSNAWKPSKQQINALLNMLEGDEEEAMIAATGTKCNKCSATGSTSASGAAPRLQGNA